MKLYVAAVALAGCTGSSPVRITSSYRFPDGTTVPADLSPWMLQVYVEDGDGFVRYPAAPVSGRADGIFEVDSVPDGGFWLKTSAPGLATYFDYYADHDTTLVSDVMGRPDAVTVQTPTPLQIDATGLAPWQFSDVLSIDCFGTGTETTDASMMPRPAVNDTAVHGTLDWGAYPTVRSAGISGLPYLMDPGAGDELTISRTTSSTTADATSWVLSQLMVMPAPKQAAGQPSTVTGAFTAVPLTTSIDLHVAADSLAAAIPAGTTGTGWDVGAFDGPGAAGAIQGPDLFGLTSTKTDAPVDAMVTYGNPFDPAWQPALYAGYGATRHFEVQGSFSWDLPFDAFYEQEPLGGGSFAFAPLVGLGQPTFGGYPIAGQTFAIPAGVAPRLAFTLPPEASHVLVQLWQIASPPMIVATLYGERSPIAVPRELFAAGKPYAFEVFAIADDKHGHERDAAIVTDWFSVQ